MLNHFQQARIAAEQVLTEIGSAFHEIFLVLSVTHFAHTLDQEAVAIILDKVVPVGAPDDFDHVPASAAEDGFEFLDDFSVAAHRSVKALQVAVHYKNQIVELFARGQRNRTEGLGFVHFTVAQEGPNFSASRRLQATIFQVLAWIGPRPMETVGNSQKSGISHGWGYELRPPPFFSSRRKFCNFSLGMRPSRYARA